MTLQLTIRLTKRKIRVDKKIKSMKILKGKDKVLPYNILSRKNEINQTNSKFKKVNSSVGKLVKTLYESVIVKFRTERNCDIRKEDLRIV